MPLERRQEDSWQCKMGRSQTVLPLATLGLCSPISETRTGKHVSEHAPDVEGKLQCPEGNEEIKAHMVAALFLIL